MKHLILCFALILNISGCIDKDVESIDQNAKRVADNFETLNQHIGELQELVNSLMDAFLTLSLNPGENKVETKEKPKLTVEEKEAKDSLRGMVDKKPDPVSIPTRPQISSPDQQSPEVNQEAPVENQDDLDVLMDEFDQFE